MNGCFQIMIKEQETALKLVPPTNNGEPISVGELLEYLHASKIENVDIKRLNAVVSTLKEPQVVSLVSQKISPVNETLVVRISQDNMEAVARFYPPSTGGARMDKDDIVSCLKLKNIQYGIDDNKIEEFLKRRQYCTDIVLAEGKPPVHGTDGRIEYFFNTDLNTRPKRNEDGSVDFFHLNTINHCKEGELLARMIPADPGESGMNLLGEAIKPRDVKKAALKYGKNITISEDKTEIYSKVNGHVSLVEDKVFVSDVFEVENVGPATGNIESEGSVQVNGNVQTGFSIRAKGNVHVQGVVEGANIVAGGDIIIDRGMNGMGRGRLNSGGCIITKFLENAVAYSEDYVEANSILHSTVTAKTEVNVDGKKGFIMGGFVRATNKITCRTLGSTMGADTNVEVGVDPEMKIQHQKLQDEMLAIQKIVQKNRPILANATQKMKKGEKLDEAQMKYIQSLALETQKKQKKYAELQAEYAGLESILERKEDACVCVRDSAYAGVKITISEATLVVKNTLQYCRLVNDQGEVRVTAL
ncbi:MAG: FapA family protein [Roseburia sp.]|nr:FapA family protein [Roseburia sp.]MCM1278017.1 FapA family protein [Robinsoniella sp.]